MKATSEQLNAFGSFVSTSRIIRKKQSKNFPTPEYSFFTGELLGYSESDEHFRKRIIKKYREND